jgi:hypothetical protein
MTPLSSIVLVTLFLVVAHADTDRCYFPNGELADSAARCWEATLGPTSLCCQLGDLCLNNTLCSSQAGFDFYRGSCVSSDWSDPGCPHFCLEPFEIDQIVQVFPCSDVEAVGWWGCGPDCYDLSSTVSNP